MRKAIFTCVVYTNAEYTMLNVHMFLAQYSIQDAQCALEEGKLPLGSTVAHLHIGVNVCF